MKEIVLTQGKVALVDDEDFDRVNQYKWCANKIRRVWYVVRNSPIIDGVGKTVLLHQEILQTDSQVDHRDGNGLNCQKHNLRMATHSQNMANSRKPAHNTSGFKGVMWHKKLSKWGAKLNLKGKQIYLGWYENKIDAAKAYDSGALKYFGEFARLNFPEKQ